MSVGTAPPTWHLKGPGQAVLFGQTIPTQVEFFGPVRPQLTLTDISLNDGGRSRRGRTRRSPRASGRPVASGWRWYFASEIVFVALAAVVLLGAIAGWRRYRGKKTVMVIAGGLLFVEAVNLGFIMVTAFTAPAILREVGSLEGLLGQTPVAPVAVAPGPPLGAVQAIVLGDSTAAGLGGPPLAHPSPTDAACERSSVAFAEVLARVNEWNVDNLACSGATIRRGHRPAVRRRPNDAAAAGCRQARTERTSRDGVVGANDLQWNTLIRLCAAADSCDNRAVTAYFQRRLAHSLATTWGCCRSSVRCRGPRRS